MRQNFDEKILDPVSFVTGEKEVVYRLPDIPARPPFEECAIAFLNEVSRVLLADTETKKFPDVVTFAFWIRRASLMKLKERFEETDSFRLGRGVVFHIAPSNVPVNFAYSLAAESLPEMPILSGCLLKISNR